MIGAKRILGRRRVFYTSEVVNFSFLSYLNSDCVILKKVQKLKLFQFSVYSVAIVPYHVEPAK